MREAPLRLLSQVNYWASNILPISLGLIIRACSSSHTHLFFFLSGRGFTLYSHQGTSSRLLWGGWKGCVGCACSSKSTLGWQATDCVCWNACRPVGHIERLSETKGHLGCFPLKGHKAAKVTGGTPKEAKRSPCYLEWSLQSMSPWVLLPLRHFHFLLFPVSTAHSNPRHFATAFACVSVG